jgi:hypothetical protein
MAEQSRREYMQRYRDANREKIRSQGRDYYAANRETINAQARARYAAKRRAGRQRTGEA